MMSSLPTAALLMFTALSVARAQALAVAQHPEPSLYWRSADNERLCADLKQAYQLRLAGVKDDEIRQLARAYGATKDLNGPQCQEFKAVMLMSLGQVLDSEDTSRATLQDMYQEAVAEGFQTSTLHDVRANDGATTYAERHNIPALEACGFTSPQTYELQLASYRPRKLGASVGKDVGIGAGVGAGVYVAGAVGVGVATGVLLGQGALAGAQAGLVALGPGGAVAGAIVGAAAGLAVAGGKALVSWIGSWF